MDENEIYETFRNGKWSKKELKELREGDIIVQGDAKLLFQVTTVHKQPHGDPPELSLAMLRKQPSIWQWNDE